MSEKEDVFTIPLYSKNPPVIFHESSEVVILRSEWERLKKVDAEKGQKPGRDLIHAGLKLLRLHFDSSFKCCGQMFGPDDWRMKCGTRDMGSLPYKCPDCQKRYESDKARIDDLIEEWK